MKLFLFFSLIVLTLSLVASDADTAYQQGLDALRHSQDDHTALVPAVKLLAKAAELYDTAHDDAKAAEVNACLYWAKKKMTLADTDGIKNNTTVVARIETATKPVETSDAQQWLDRANAYAKNQGDPLLVAIRYFEVGDRFKDTDAGRTAIDLSLKAMQKIGTQAKLAEYKPVPTDGKVYIQSEPLGAAIILNIDGVRKDSGKKTPSVVTLPKGAQTVSIEMSGMKPVNVPLVVIETMIRPPTVKLLPVTVNADIIFESGWSVFIDGKLAIGDDGKKLLTPCTAPMPLGAHTIYLAKEGFSDLTQRVTAKDAPVTVEIKSKPSSGSSAILQALKQDKQYVISTVEASLIGKWEKKDGNLVFNKDHTVIFSADPGISHWEVVDKNQFLIRWAWGPTSTCVFTDEDTFSEKGKAIFKRVKSN